MLLYYYTSVVEVYADIDECRNVLWRYDMKTFFSCEKSQESPVLGHVTVPLFLAAISSRA
jgi:hypothetical protein